MELYVYLSRSTVKNFGFEDSELPLPDVSDVSLPKNWWSVWRCDVMIMDPDGEQNIMLFTNEDTLISFICGGFAEDFDGLIQEFEAAFLGCLKNNGLRLPSTLQTYVVPLLGEPSDFVDNMDLLVEAALEDMIDRKLTPAAAQLNLHTRPWCVVVEDTPGELFLERLAAQPPLGFDFEEPDDVIPFPET